MQPAPSNCTEKTLSATSVASKPQPERTIKRNFLESQRRRPQGARLTRVLKAYLPKERQAKGAPRAVDVTLQHPNDAEELRTQRRQYTTLQHSNNAEELRTHRRQDATLQYPNDAEEPHTQRRQDATSPRPNDIEPPVAGVAGEGPLPDAVVSNKCKACNNLDPLGHADTQTVNFDGNQISTLRLGPSFPSKDCGYCDLIFRAVMEFYPFSGDLKHERTWGKPTVAILLTEHHPISLYVPVAYGGAITHCGWVDIYAPHDIPLLPALGKASDISESSDSQSCFAFIQNCLLDCRQHTECNTFPSSAPPKRLLYLEEPLSSSELSSHQNLSIRLCETNGQPHRYATLSYCWGSAQTIKTLQTNIREFQAGIDWNTLPKTFQEATIVALRLEIRYLWIDALCIIQDDKIDWDTEAAKMGDIYQNSYLTIAATSSPSSEIPFLRPRPPEYKPKTLQFSNPHRLSNAINNPSFFDGTSDIIPLRIRQGPTMYGVHLSELFNPRIHGALTTRGWALQERVLSNRIVHFTDEGIKWECRMSIRNEDQRRCFPGHVQKWKDFSNTTERSTQRSELQSFWRVLLVDYTKRRLTKREDILPALSGIAARMQSFHNSHYFAGLWYDRFVEDLCWRPLGTGGEYSCNPPLPSDSVPREDVDLPSWSWISIRRPVSFAVIDEAGTFNPYSKIVSCDCTPADSNPFGRVLNGCAVIEGPLFEASISYNGVQATFTTPQISRARIELQAPLMEGTFVHNGGWVKTARRARKGEIPKSFEGTVWCLYLGHWRPGAVVLTVGALEHEFLLILGLSTRVAGAYERIGNVYSVDHYWVKEMAEVWKKAPVQQVSIV